MGGLRLPGFTLKIRRQFANDHQSGTFELKLVGQALGAT